MVFTGGHHTSALVVAKLLQDKGWNIVWFGHRRSMWGDKADSAEYRDVTEAGIKFHNLIAGKFYKTYHPLKLIRIPISFIQAFILLLIRRPVGIVSFGGYLAVPAVVCGWLLGIPAITHEQTVVVGWANRLVGFFAQKVAVAWPESLSLFEKNKAVFVGLPLRPEIKALKKKGTAKKVYEPITVFVTGGKQGSHTLNEVIFKNVNRLCEKYNIIHQTGSSTVYDDFSHAQTIHLPNYKPFAFDSGKWVTSLAQADVVISRAGAHAVYELGYLGKRSVLVPIPWVSHNEQQQNARLLQEAKIGVIVEEKSLSGKTLTAAIEKARNLNPAPLNLPGRAEKAMVRLIEQEFGQ